jgi:hypothetical protein
MTTTTKNTAADCGLGGSITTDAVREKLIARFARWLARGFPRLRDVAPYAAIELLLPGGSLLALVWWLYRRQKSRRAQAFAIPLRGL